MYFSFCAVFTAQPVWLHVESKQYDVPLLHDIFLPLTAEEPGLLHSLFASFLRNNDNDSENDNDNDKIITVNGNE